MPYCLSIEIELLQLLEDYLLDYEIADSEIFRGIRSKKISQ